MSTAYRLSDAAPGRAIYFLPDETIGIRQTGDQPLSLIISYPLATRAG